MADGADGKRQVAVLDNIAPVGLEQFPESAYELNGEAGNPDLILVRSSPLHDAEFGSRLLAVGRAGAGVNNIPVSRLTALGVPVFNAPGANANAVKELVIAAMLMSMRKLPRAWQFAEQIDPKAEDFDAQVESGKKQFRGVELPGKTLGIIGLGAIGTGVANAAIALGMKVTGFDPSITVSNAWQLSSQVTQARNIDDLLHQSDVISVHVPLVEQTRGMINRSRLKIMRDGVCILNFSRADIVDSDAIASALDEGKVGCYACDFPSPRWQNNPRVIALPHLGASTREAEENCAAMVVQQLRAYVEDGEITNSVNFPPVSLVRKGESRLSVVNENRPDMISGISKVLGQAGVNIEHLVNESRDEIAYTLVDVDSEPSDSLLAEIGAIPGIIRARWV